MKSHPTDARSARPATVFSLLAAMTAAMIALLPHVLATAAPANDQSAASSYGVWSDSTVPAVPSSDEAQSVTLGLVFSSATAGRLHAVQYYAAGANRVATTGDVWNGAGRRIASVTFPATENDGWKTAWLSSSVRIRADEKYTVSYRAPLGRNAMETGVFDSGRTLSAKDLTAHRGTFGHGTGRPTETSNGAHYFIDVLFAPSSTTSTPAPSPTPTPTPTPSGAPLPADFPTPTSVGPATAPTTTYAGSCRVTTDNLVIDAKVVNCQADGLTIARGVTGVTIRNSVVNGGVFTEILPGDDAAEDTTHPTVFTIESSRIVAAATTAHDRALGFAHFVVRDSYIQGSHSGLWAFNKAVIEDSYITTDGTDTHQSGLRMLKNSTLRGNTVFCNPAGTDQDGGCSAAAVFYREFGVPTNLTIERNYFRNTKSTSGQGPWFATRFIDCQAHDDCTNLRVAGNLFDLGQGTDGGEFPTYGGNVWSDNWWTDGVPASSDQSR